MCMYNMCMADRQKLAWSRATCQARQQQQQQQQRDTARAKLPGKGRHSGREGRERSGKQAGKAEQRRDAGGSAATGRGRANK